MTTTLQAYGFDSFPYLHVARRRCVSYTAVLCYVHMLDRLPTKQWMHLEVDKLDEADMEAIFMAWRSEMHRRHPLAGILDLATPAMASKIVHGIVVQ